MKRPLICFLWLLIPIFSLFGSTKQVEINKLHYLIDTQTSEAQLTFEYQESVSNYSDLDEIIIPSTIVVDGNKYTVTSIGSWALNRVRAKSIALPSTLTSIGYESMAVIPNCKELIIPEGVVELGQNVFMKSGFVRISLPNSLQEIPRGACAMMTNLNYIKIGSGVKVIGAEAFNYTENIDSIACYCNTPPQITSTMSGWTFTTNTLSRTVLRVPSASINAYKEDKNWKSFSHIESLSKNSDDNGQDMSDEGAKGLKYILNDNNLTAMLTFEVQEKSSNYQNLGKIDVPSSITREGKSYTVDAVGPWALNRVQANSISLPPSISRIHKESLARIPNVKQLVIPEGVTTIDDNAFTGSNIEHLVISNTVRELGYGACAEMAKLRYLILGSGLETIGGESFNYTNNLDTIECRAVYPPDMKQGRGATFTSSTYKNTILLVPYESINDYRQHSVWGNFKNIKPIESKIRDSNELPVYNGKVLVNGIYYFLYPKSRTATATYNLYQDRLNYINLEAIIVPTTFIYDGIEYTVTKIGESAFDRCYHVKYISIPESITEIEKDGFCSNRILTEVVIGNNVKSIGYGAFAYNYKLEHLTIGSSIQSIDGEAFNYDDNIQDITIYATNPPKLLSWGNFDSDTYSKAILYVPKGCLEKYKKASGWSKFTNIQEINTIRVNIDGIWYQPDMESGEATVVYDNLDAKKNYRALDNVILPETIQYENRSFKVTAIGNLAFKGSSLKSIELPANLKSIGIGALSCLESSIDLVVVPDNVTVISEEAFSNSRIKEIIIGKNVTSIGFNACSKMSLLTSVTLGESVATLGRGVFSYSDNILEIISNASIPPIAMETENMFTNSVYSTAILRVPSESKTDYQKSELWENFAKIYSLKSEQDRYLSNGIYYRLDSDNFTAVVEHEFNDGSVNYPHLTHIKIPETISKDGNTFNVCAIGESAFANTANLKSIEIPASITSIGANAFKGSSIESITCLAVFPPQIESTQNTAFDNSTYASASLCVPAGSLDYYRRASGWSEFYDIQSIGIIRIGSVYYKIDQATGTASTTYQYYQNSYNYDKMEYVMIPETIEWNGEQYTVTKIASSSFDRCHYITHYDIPNSVLEIETDGFCSNHSLTNVVIGNNVKRIGYGAFAFNYSLQTLVLGENVETIGGEAFNYDSKLETVTCLSKIPPVMEPGRSSTFSAYTYNNATLYVPEGCIQAYRNSRWNLFAKIAEIKEDQISIDQTQYVIDEDNGEATLTYEEYNDTSNYNTLESIEIASEISIPNPRNISNRMAIAGGHYPVTTIGELCFNHSNLQAVKIPMSIRSIERLAFANISKLKEVIIPKSVTSIGNNAFSQNINLEKVIIEDGIESIGYGAFSFNPVLKDVDLGRKIKTIGGDAFSQSPSIETLVVRADLPPVVEVGNGPSFSASVYQNAQLYVPDNALSTYKEASTWSFFKNILPLSSYNPFSVQQTLINPESNQGNFNDIPDDGVIKVYSIDGKVIFFGEKRQFNPTGGMYIICYAKKSFKVILE